MLLIEEPATPKTFIERCNRRKNVSYDAFFDVHLGSGDFEHGFVASRGRPFDLHIGEGVGSRAKDTSGEAGVERPET